MHRCDDQEQELAMIGIVKALSKSMLKEYGPEMRQLCTKPDLSDEQIYTSYCTVMENTLGSGIRWGRIVSLMTFTGLLAAFLIKRQQQCKVESLLEWERTFINTRCRAWIEEQGGWVSSVVGVFL